MAGNLRIPTAAELAEIDRADIKAGDYVLVVEFWERILSKPGEPFDFERHYKGETVTLNTADARRLVLAGAVVSASQADADPVIPGSTPSVAPGGSADADEFDPTKGGGIKETEAYVGDDKVKAAAMLELEQAKGDKARKSLVEKLEAIVTDPDPSQA